MVEMDNALALILSAAQEYSPVPEIVDLKSTADLIALCGRITASEVCSPEAFPRFPCSIMDGYAVNAPITEVYYDISKQIQYVTD